MMAAVTEGGITEDMFIWLRNLCSGVVSGKGVLATDETPEAMFAMFQAIDIPIEDEYRRLFRQIMYSSKGLKRYISLVLLTEESIFQNDDEGVEFVELLRKKNLLIGLRVDQGLKDGMDGLQWRVDGFRERGASVLKWRGFFKVGTAHKETIFTMARFAALCQDRGLVPLLAVDLLADGSHSIEEAKQELEDILISLMKTLLDLNVRIEGILLCVPFVQAGRTKNSLPPDPQISAAATSDTLINTLPQDLGGLLFMSSGFSEESATITLDCIMKSTSLRTPWKIGFCFGRSSQASALKVWNGNYGNVSEAQDSFLKRAAANQKALVGEYEQGSVKDVAEDVDLFIEDYFM